MEKHFTQSSEPINGRLDQRSVTNSFGNTETIRGQFGGIVKREYFATHLDIKTDELTGEIRMLLMGGYPSPSNKNEQLKWILQSEAKYRVMKADALIEALNEEYYK